MLIDQFFLFLEAYHNTYHRFIDAIFTAKLGIGYITGVLELLLGALIYIMCLPFVRKSGHFQVRNWIIIEDKNTPDWCSYSIGVTC